MNLFTLHIDVTKLALYDRMADIPELAYEMARARHRKGLPRDSRLEAAIMKDAKLATNYSFNVLENRWPEAESVIITDLTAAVNYAKWAIEGRWPEAESSIIKDPMAASSYAVGVLHRRWPRAESTIMLDDNAAVLYWERVLGKKPWPELAARLIKKPLSYNATQYALELNKKQRWLEFETAVNDPSILHTLANSTATNYLSNYASTLRYFVNRKLHWDIIDKAPESLLRAAFKSDPYMKSALSDYLIAVGPESAPGAVGMFKNSAAVIGKITGRTKKPWPGSIDVLKRDPKRAVRYAVNTKTRLANMEQDFRKLKWAADAATRNFIKKYSEMFGVDL